MGILERSGILAGNARLAWGGLIPSGVAGKRLSEVPSGDLVSNA